MLHGYFKGNKATCYGNEHEESAINDYIISQTTSKSVVTVARSGLIVRRDEPWLACSPDGLISNSSTPDKGLLEVKCPLSCSSMSFEEAAKSASFCLKREKDSFTLRQSHSYFYQIQHSLLVTRLLWADFIVWSPTEMFVQRVHADQSLQNRMLLKLKCFFQTHLLPALFAEVQRESTTSSIDTCPQPPSITFSKSNEVFCFSFERQFSQSTIDGRNGSSACTVIACYTAYSVLAGKLPVITQLSDAVPEGVTTSFVQCIRTGNGFYDRANLDGQLLAVYDALHLLTGTGLSIAPRRDIGCRNAESLACELKGLSEMARAQGSVIAAVQVQHPLMVGLAFGPDGIIMIFDSHLHGDHGAMIAAASLSDPSSVATFLQNLLGSISDSHLCRLTL